MTIWGLKASGGTYAAIAALTNILAAVIGAGLYEIFLMDSSRGESTCGPISRRFDFMALLVLPHAQQDYLHGHQAHSKLANSQNGSDGEVSPTDEEKQMRST